MNKSSFTNKIVEWYQANLRNLPWRQTVDPFRIWLSEIILQQTRVAQGQPYYLKFIERFPDVFALAKASEQEILRMWQGLGYYTRARNLHQCAKWIVKNHGGRFPDNSGELQKLPGIGPYTAAAIASIAFGERIAALDGNAYRVLSRVFGIEDDISSEKGRSRFAQVAGTLISKKSPEAFNQAMMDFGAMRCTPRNPLCDDCIFSKQCVAFARGWQKRLPVKSKKTKVTKRYFNYFVIEQGKKRMMRRREHKDIWEGLYDFYLVETKTKRGPKFILDRAPEFVRMNWKIRGNGISNWYRHSLTHQKLWVRFVTIQIPSTRSGLNGPGSSNLKFYTAKQINKLPKPALVSRYLHDESIL